MDPIIFIPDSLHHFLWFAAAVMGCFALGATAIIWNENAKRESAEAKIDDTRITWRPLQYGQVRGFRKVIYKPATTETKAAAAPSTPSADDVRARVLESDLRRVAYLTTEQLTAPLTDIHNIHTGDVVAHRFDMQWQHPAFGVIDYDTLITTADRAALTGPLYLSWLRRALEHCHAQQFYYLPLPAAIANWKDAPRILRRMCLDSHIDPRFITFCVRAAGDYAIALALRAQGFGLALDDCHSLTDTALQTLPLTAVIASGTLTNGLHENPASMVMAETIATLAFNLGLTAIAMNVAAAVDQAALSGFGYSNAAGPYFSATGSRQAVAA